jgi:hypothetical protein
MSLLIQHGHGKSDKIDLCLKDDSADGVIFAARNETPEKLEACLDKLTGEHEDKYFYLDPQFYLTSFSPPNDRYLPEYPYYKAGLGSTAFANPATVSKYAKLTLEYQQGLPVDRLISPTIMFSSFDDASYQSALSLAYASLDAHAGIKDAKPLLLSFVFAEEALASREQLDHFLDAVTQEDWGMNGFYFIVEKREDGYNQRFDEERLAHLLYATYVLSVTNEFEVLFGYTDFVGILLRAVGAESFASGWAQSARRFKRKAFTKSKGGGQQPRPRYSSAPLFNSILVDELQDIYDTGRLDEVMSGADLDSIITDASSPQAATDWGLAVSQQQHWQTLSLLDEAIDDEPKSDAKNTLAKLRAADGLYRALELEGVQFDRNSNKDHLKQWIGALKRLQTLTGWTAG